MLPSVCKIIWCLEFTSKHSSWHWSHFPEHKTEGPVKWLVLTPPSPPQSSSPGDALPPVCTPSPETHMRLLEPTVCEKARLALQAGGRTSSPWTWGLAGKGCNYPQAQEKPLGGQQGAGGGSWRNLPQQNVGFHTSCKVQNDIKLSVPFPWSKGPEILPVSVCRQTCCGAGGLKPRSSQARGRPHCVQALGTGAEPSLLALNLSFLMVKLRLWGQEICNEDLIICVKLLCKLWKAALMFAH